MAEIDYEWLRIPSWVQKLSKPLGILVALFTVGFLGISDYLTGPEISFSIFYLIPVSFATLFAGRDMGLLLSVVSASTWLWVDLVGDKQYSYWFIPYWNAAVRLGYFCLHTMLLTILLSFIEWIKNISLKDPLTGVPTWKYFEEIAKRELQKARRARQSVSVAYVDLDNLKMVNDEFGHDVGDDLICTIGEVIQSQIRPSDILARIGGDEFVILFPDTNYDGARYVLERINKTVVKEMEKNRWPVTLSVGAVTFKDPPLLVDSVVKKADELMYLVKHAGKNSIRHEEWPPASEG